MEACKAFFERCETGQGWSACQEFCTPDASFEAQSEPLADVKTLEAYCDWMKGLATSTMPGCRYDLHHSSWDEGNKSACFFATFHGTHTGEGGPVPPTNKSIASHYVYAITVDGSGKISKMIKIWNAPWALKQVGWM
mmetsp:Transcript_13582/g.29324  ORF Transcript_13582/g.29324 Transcript_13582/m.29324 type:complete len:137 (-) Transcript_13582:35-445(-)